MSERIARLLDELVESDKIGCPLPPPAPQCCSRFCVKGALALPQHDWVAEECGYVYEPPSETGTLVVPGDVDDMINYFQVNGVTY